MSTINTSTNSLSNASQGPLAKSARGWDIYKKLHENDRPEFKAIAGKEKIEFRPIDPIKKTTLESNPDLFTGAELNSAVALGDSQDAKETRARIAAEKLVATTLVNPILKQVRESNDTPPPFGPGKAEKQFGSFLDAKLSEQIVSAAQFPLVKRIQQDLLKSSAYFDEATKASTQNIDAQIHNPLDLVG